ncbi:hypothetical protein PbJCM13498_36370 [Prolixibacter bellariivorans]|uniref:Uncharacterized protein n=3 Tax=Prolixibacter bellariivorans TaxID=314319 RepID=A0A5M4B3U0_9BACT|nr:hypothetical protein PbJCM13498_36370 [Prolixibacter bellariivorans]
MFFHYKLIIMKQIEDFNLYPLRNNEHDQFMTDIKKLIEATTPETLGITALYPEFIATLNKLDSAVRVGNGSSLSAKISEMDNRRDRTWRAIHKRVDATIDSPVEEEVNSAELVQRVISLYGDIRRVPYNEESAAISNLVNDLQSVKNAPHVEQIGISHWVAALKDQNQVFQDIFNERNTELSERGNGDVRSVRLVIDPLYEKIIERINATITLNMAAESVEAFVNELNEKIKYYKVQLSIRAGRNNKE